MEKRGVACTNAASSAPTTAHSSQVMDPLSPRTTVATAFDACSTKGGTRHNDPCLCFPAMEVETESPRPEDLPRRRMKSFCSHGCSRAAGLLPKMDCGLHGSVPWSVSLINSKIATWTDSSFSKAPVFMGRDEWINSFQHSTDG